MKTAQRSENSKSNEQELDFRLRQERFVAATDSEYWACLCFQNREQKEAFLSALGILDIGDKYLDGPLVAKRLGIELPSAEVPYNPTPRIDPDWAAMT
ncbi:MAG: hypothetical protein QM741_10665 [Rudaea sp.]|uniref:hypothetical protein n=1 Tax=Rudaea sp. TaxID=2136325 RepID=UPI0039E5E636